MHKYTGEVHKRGRQRWYSSGTEFWSGCLYICPYHCVSSWALTFSISLPPLFYQGSTLSLPCFIIYPQCFCTAFTFDVTAQLNSREKGGAPDKKNPDPYYSLAVYSSTSIYLYYSMLTHFSNKFYDFPSFNFLTEIRNEPKCHLMFLSKFRSQTFDGHVPNLNIYGGNFWNLLRSTHIEREREKCKKKIFFDVGNL